MREKEAYRNEDRKIRKKRKSIGKVEDEMEGIDEAEEE